jgi:hypothetical protein
MVGFPFRRFLVDHPPGRWRGLGSAHDQRRPRAGGATGSGPALLGATVMSERCNDAALTRVFAGMGFVRSCVIADLDDRSEAGPRRGEVARS